MKLITRYIITEFLKWFFVAFAFFFAVFFVNNILLLAKDILAKRVPVLQVLRLLFFTFPTILSYTFPFSILLATIISMIQHASKFELLAIQASGVSLFKCYIPIACTALLFSAVSFGISDYLLPRSAVSFIRVYQEILFTTPTLELEEHSVRKYQENIIITGEINDTIIHTPLIIEPNSTDTQRRVIAAESALLEIEQAQGVLSLNMRNVYGHSNNISKYQEFDHFSAALLRYNVLLQTLNIGLRTPNAREMRVADIKKYLDENSAIVAENELTYQRQLSRERYQLTQRYFDGIINLQNRSKQPRTVLTTLKTHHNRLEEAEQKPVFDQAFRIFETEYHRKYSLPSACFFLTILAFPVGIHLKRANWSIGFGIGICASIVFWILLIGGQAVSIQRKSFFPLMVMWAPNITLAATGIVIQIVVWLKK